MSGGQVNLIDSGCQGVLYNMQRLCGSVWFSFAGAEMGDLLLISEALILINQESSQIDNI